MIIVLHILGVGGVIYTIDLSSPVYVPAWTLEFAAYCAVNCYAIISGYVGVKSEFRLSGILRLWLQVVFCSAVISTVFVLTGTGVTTTSVIKSLFPVSSRYYWYFTAYFCLYFLTPFLNRMITSLNKKTARYMMCILIILFSVMPTLTKTDLFFVNHGYSALWLIVLYVFGGVIRYFYSDTNIKKRTLFIGYVGAVGVTLLIKLLIEFAATKGWHGVYESNFLMNYNSPTIFLAGVCLVLLFAQLKVCNVMKQISRVAVVTFGVYIIHAHPLIYERILANRFIGFTTLHPVASILAVLLTAVLIFVICGVLEFLRLQLFKLFRVGEICKFIEGKARKLFHTLF